MQSCDTHGYEQVERCMKGPQQKRVAKARRKGANATRHANATRGNDEEVALNGVVDDLDAVHQWLTGPQVGADTHAVQVECGYHGRDEVTKSSTVSNLRALFRNEQADVFLWFYSGHGDEDFWDEEDFCDKDDEGVLLLYVTSDEARSAMLKALAAIGLIADIHDPKWHDTNDLNLISAVAKMLADADIDPSKIKDPAEAAAIQLAKQSAIRLATFEDQLIFDDVIQCFTEAMDQQGGCGGRKLIICLDSCGSGHWVRKLKARHLEWRRDGKDYEVGIQAACGAGFGSFDSVFTGTFMAKQQTRKNFDWVQLAQVGNIQYPEFYTTWGSNQVEASAVQVGRAEFRFFKKSMHPVLCCCVVDNAKSSFAYVQNSGTLSLSPHGYLENKRTRTDHCTARSQMQQWQLGCTTFYIRPRISDNPSNILPTRRSPCLVKHSSAFS